MNQTLSQHEETLVLAAIAALEITDGVVAPTTFPALGDDALRAEVARRLAGAGRVLLQREYRTVTGYTTGYDDAVASRLAQQGIGTLPPVDRAVLALVLLRTVAMPRAAGTHRSTSWITGGPGTTVEELHQNNDPYLTYEHLRASLRRLRARRLVRTAFHGTILPGPALLRLTDAQTARLWEDLILVTLPDSLYAQVIRRRRNEQDQPAPAAPPTELEP